MKTMNDRRIAVMFVLIALFWATNGSLFPPQSAAFASIQENAILLVETTPFEELIDCTFANTILISASSPFEDLVDYALAGNRRGMKRALKAYEQQAKDVNTVLSEKARQQLEKQVAGIRKAMQEGDNHSVASHSVEAYGLLVESLNPKNLKTPKEVALLDYVGFKMRVIMNAQSPDWAAAQSTAEEAKRLWTAVEPRVHDGGLRDAVNTTIEGMLKATASRNAEMAVFAAEEDLAQVDLLEKYFEEKKK